MHASLFVDEIVRLIACELVASQGKATAVALACCCKSFEDPVLDTLWETQDRLDPLLDTFPEDVWNEDESTVSAHKAYVVSYLNYFVRKCFRRLPTALELARFRKYARRVRTFSDAGGPHRLSSEVFLVLQSFGFNEPLLPNLKTLVLWPINVELAPYILFLVSPVTTSIYVRFNTSPLPPKGLVASIITVFSARCPDLQKIYLHDLPRDPMITAAVSELLFTVNHNTLQAFDVDSPLTEEAREVVHRLPDIRRLMVVIERGTSLPSLVLPSLIELTVKHDHEDDCLEMFHGATLGKLEFVEFVSGSEEVGDFLGTFERLAHAASVQNTLSRFYLRTPCPWSPTFSPPLSFTQLRSLVIEFSCADGCSSVVDDQIITDLARAMPKLRRLALGDPPCHQIPTGVTAKGLMVLAHHCPDLSELCVHFQVASLAAPPATIGVTPNIAPTALRRDCALRYLTVGEIPMPEEWVLMVALTLVRIFPRIEVIKASHVDGEWGKVWGAIYLSRQIIDHSATTLQSDGPLGNFPEG